jgi:hypothetical protein
MTTTIAEILRAIERCRPKPVYVFCHPDDRERITTALTLLPSVRVLTHQLVPVGQLWIAEDLPFTDEDLQERL